PPGRNPRGGQKVAKQKGFLHRNPPGRSAADRDFSTQKGGAPSAASVPPMEDLGPGHADAQRLPDPDCPQESDQKCSPAANSRQTPTGTGVDKGLRGSDTRGDAADARAHRGLKGPSGSSDGTLNRAWKALSDMETRASVGFDTAAGEFREVHGRGRPSNQFTNQTRLRG
ncbi:predicted protein, partial [Histoplasma mississippiense (nom. inval.)]|uniref:predicted protein n=1 Tax=Ajellomyces capsulatus (strain NAm1 / WU24) TaxID=2059318 RepID=UPI000157D6B5